MKHPALLLSALLAAAAATAAQPDRSVVRAPVKEGSRQLAFPGAVGWGRFARGARAGANPAVYHVTNLDDAGPGSLRDAVSKPNRVVVFDVAGVIRLQSRVTFAPGLLIAGQTAPGDGVTVYGDGCSFSGADDLICRYVRWRMGKGGAKGKDCAGISRGTNMIFDHCSFSWGRDETFSINPDRHRKGALGDITLQHCIISHGLLPHSAGGLIQTDRVTLYRNLYSCNSTRNNKVKGTCQYANNIVYNWKNGCFIMGGDSSGTSRCNIEGNLFINGPSGGGDAFVRGNDRFHFFSHDNWQDANADGVFNPVCLDGVQTGGGDRVAARFDYPALPLVPAKSLLKTLDRVGAALPARDPYDTLVVKEVQSLGTAGALISSEAELACGAPSTWKLAAGRAQPDTDGDGLPDAWEAKNGTDRRKPDATALARNGYLNIENYINSISVPKAK